MSPVLQHRGQDTDALGVNRSGWRVIIAGSRTIMQRRALDRAMDACPFRSRISLVLSGAEPGGVDRLGEAWARDNGIEVKPFPADWSMYGKSAGPRRNAEMVAEADALVLLWTGDSESSPGSADVLEKAKRKGLRIHEVKLAVVG